MRHLIELLLLIFVVTSASSQVDSSTTGMKSDKGHWFAFRVGTLSGGSDIGNRWIILAGYEGRFSRNWSVPIEAHLYEDVNHSRPWAMVTAALKLRILLPHQSTNLFAQGGIGTYSIGLQSHYAIGFEYGLADRLSLALQAKKFPGNSDLRQWFITAGININATSDRLRLKYEVEGRRG